MQAESAKPDEQPQNWYFSFGHGQIHRGRYVKIFGTFRSARDQMFAHFGPRWSMQYEEPDMLKHISRYGWTELPLPTTQNKDVPT